MQGPSAATMSLRVAPRRSIAVDGRFDHARQRPFPARMRRADDARALVGEQDHAAVGARHAKRKARGRGHQRVAAGARIRRPKLSDGEGVGRMNWNGTARRSGAAPSAAAIRARFSVTASGASREPTPPLSEA